jgi:hypothetical protein
MGHHAMGRRGENGAEQLQIPIAEYGESFESLAGWDSGISSGPSILIERLDRRRVFGQGLAQAKCEYDFAVGQVANDLRRAPFSGFGRGGYLARPGWLR